MEGSAAKKETASRVLKNGLLFTIGGSAYVSLELLWRGYSHWSMFCLGGACFHLIGRIGRLRLPRLHRCGLCAAGVTAAEFVCGCIVNVWLRLGVWDYSNRAFNVWGQICPLYSVLWGLLSLPTMKLYEKVSQLLCAGHCPQSGQTSQCGALAQQISRPK